MLHESTVGSGRVDDRAYDSVNRAVQVASKDSGWLSVYARPDNHNLGEASLTHAPVVLFRAEEAVYEDNRSIRSRLGLFRLVVVVGKTQPVASRGGREAT